MPPRISIIFLSPSMWVLATRTSPKIIAARASDMTTDIVWSVTAKSLQESLSERRHKVLDRCFRDVALFWMPRSLSRVTLVRKTSA